MKKCFAMLLLLVCASVEAGQSPPATASAMCDTYAPLPVQWVSLVAVTGTTSMVVSWECNLSTTPTNAAPKMVVIDQLYTNGVWVNMARMNAGLGTNSWSFTGFAGLTNTVRITQVNGLN